MKFIFALAALLAAQPAMAQDLAQAVRRQPSLGDYDAKLDPVTVSPLNCEKLSGTPLVCVVNKTHASIKAISCDGNWYGKQPIAVPGGRIQSGAIGVVDFSHGNCKSGIHVTTSDGQQHEIEGQDVSSLTILTIESEDW